MNNLIIEEKSIINDTASLNIAILYKGTLIFKDEDGNIIYKTHNMITKNGREILYSLIAGTSAFTLANLTPIVGYDPNNNSVTPDDTYNNYSNTIINSNYLKAENKAVVPDNDGLTFKFTIDITNITNNITGNSIFNWIGLQYTNGSNITLFSRSKFNNTIVPPSRVITIDYILHV